jgi:UrcA family protein
MHHLTRILIGAVVALLICGAEGMLFAAGASAAELESRAVRYSDLDLTRAADVARLYQRISAAAEQACGPRLLTGSRLPQPSYLRCFNDAVARAVARVDRPALSAYHQQHVGPAQQRDASIARR